MKNKLALTNKLVAAILTLVIIPVLFISLFTIPIELIAFNPASYLPVLEQEVYKDEFPVLVSEVLSNQLFNLDPVSSDGSLNYLEKMSTVLVKYIPSEWLDSLAKNLIEKGIAYFNFKTPYDSIEVNISALKESLIQNSSALSEEYLESLNTCLPDQETAFFINGKVKLTSIAICKPSSANYAAVLDALDQFILEKTNQVPASINVFGVIPAQLISGKRFFYFYSIGRWMFRLLPFITIFLLIFIAQLLRKNRKLMRRWSGLILTVVPSISLIGLIIILIGFDQFIGLIFKQYLSNVIAGFGKVLLWMMQSVGNQVLLSAAGVSGAVALFGLILLLFAKFTKEEVIENIEEPIEKLELEDGAHGKEIIPETIEEIEKKEVEVKKGEKKK